MVDSEEDRPSSLSSSLNATVSLAGKAKDSDLMPRHAVEFEVELDYSL